MLRWDKPKDEELSVQWLATVVETFSNDPLEEFIGAFKNDIPDWADQHDKHLGQSLMEEMREEEAKQLQECLEGMVRKIRDSNSIGKNK